MFPLVACTVTAYRPVGVLPPEPLPPHPISPLTTKNIRNNRSEFLLHPRLLKNNDGKHVEKKDRNPLPTLPVCACPSSNSRSRGSVGRGDLDGQPGLALAIQSDGLCRNRAVRSFGQSVAGQETAPEILL